MVRFLCEKSVQTAQIDHESGSEHDGSDAKLAAHGCLAMGQRMFNGTDSGFDRGAELGAASLLGDQASFVCGAQGLTVEVDDRRGLRIVG